MIKRIAGSLERITGRFKSIFYRSMHICRKCILARYLSIVSADALLAVAAVWIREHKVDPQ